MKIGFMHKEGRMKYVYEMVKNDYETEVFDDHSFDYDVIVMGMDYFDEQSFDKEYLEMVQASIIFVCYDAIELMKERFQVVCLKDSEDFLVKNAQVTAWGILGILLDSCEECLTELMIDVVGYGRCGKAIVQLLDALGVQCRVIVKEVKNYTREVMHFEEYLFKKPAKWIIQTADICIFDHDWVLRSGKPIIIDITSKFVGTKNLQDEDIKIHYAKALPDQYCIKSSAKTYYEALLEVLV